MQREIVADDVLLELRRGHALGAVVGDGGRHHDDIGVRLLGEHREPELLGGLRAHDAHALRQRHLDMRRDERDDRAAGLRGDRDLEALASARAVADVAHGIDRLARAASGHDDPKAGEVAGPAATRAARTISPGSLIRPAPLSEPVSRPTPGPTTVTPRLRSRLRFACVAACSHISVCIAGATTSGADEASTGRREQVVGHAGGKAGKRVRGRGRDDDEVGRLPDRDVADLRDAFVEVGVDRVAADRLERRTADESQRRLRRDDVHVVAGEHEFANDRDGLVRGDAAGDPDDDVQGHVSRGSVDATKLELVLVDLAERDRERLVIDRRVDERPDVVEEAAVLEVPSSSR